MRGAVSTALQAALVFLIASFLIITVQSYVSGFYPLVVVESGSMMPVIDVGDVLIVTPANGHDVSADPTKGDVIVFYRPPYYGDANNLIVHRAIAIAEDGIITKGDANAYPDPWSPVPFKYVIGKWTGIKIPYWMGLGPVSLFLKGKLYPPYDQILIVLLVLLNVALILLSIRRQRKSG